MSSVKFRSNGTGYIRWPRSGNGFVKTGENGMWVYGFWPADPTIAQLDAGLELVVTEPEPRTYLDSFVRCHGPLGTLALPLPDSVASPNEDLLYLNEQAPAYVGPSGNPDQRLAYLEHTLDAGRPILAGICLGTIDETWLDEEGGYWCATEFDLTRKGRKLINLMSDLYGADRRPLLVTYLDT